MGLFGRQKSSDSGRQKSSDSGRVGSFKKSASKDGGSLMKAASFRKVGSDDAGAAAAAASGSSGTGAGSGSAGVKSQPSVEFECKTPGQMLARVEVLKLKVAEVEKECIKIESQIPSAYRVMSVEQRVDDDLALQKKKYEKAQEDLENAKKDSVSLLANANGPKGLRHVVQRYGDRILVLELEEVRDRDEHTALLKAIAEQENIMRALETQCENCPRILNSRIRVPPKFKRKALPEFQEWRIEHKKVLKLLKSEEESALRARATKVDESLPGVSVSAAASKFGAKGGSSGEMHGLFPDASRSAIARSDSGKKKPSKWAVEDPAARSRERSPGLSRSSSGDVVKPESVKETDVLRNSSGGSVKNLFAKFDSGEVAVHEKESPNDAMLELQKIQKRSSSKELVSSFEKVGLSGSHDEEFKNKEFDKTVFKDVHMDKKFLL